MEPRLIVIKLFLKELDIPSEIRTVDDRKKIQKAIYLGQLSGVDLGYRFSWYLMGPYCPDLSKEYYSLVEAIESGDKGYKEMRIVPSLGKKLRKIRPLLSVPEDVKKKLKQEEWLELVSSLHFLIKISGYTKKKADDLLKNQKPRLSKYVKKAKEKLLRHKLLQ
ncbi:MAG: hypothetical protein IEMM0002_0439 [bacterium]|nr:MAG: hypothetical protein IEMM0002_0439 [bacterium]